MTLELADNPYLLMIRICDLEIQTTGPRNLAANQLLTLWTLIALSTSAPVISEQSDVFAK